MNGNEKQKLREFLKKSLEKFGDHNEFSDDESIFISGRLDSFSMMNLIMYLEQSSGMDFSSIEFDVGLVDTVNSIEAFVDSARQ